MAETNPTIRPRTGLFEGLVSPQQTPVKNNPEGPRHPYKTGISVLDDDLEENMDDDVSDIGSNYGDRDQANTGIIHQDIEYQDITDDTTVPFQDAEEVLPEDPELKRFQEEAKKLQEAQTEIKRALRSEKIKSSVDAIKARAARKATLKEEIIKQ